MSIAANTTHSGWAQSVLSKTRQHLAGMDEVVRLCLVAYCTGGHVLLEGNPGLGKTMLVKHLAKALDLEHGRIQFTPDLMPSDITGTMLPRYDNKSGAMSEWSFEPGPIFASLLLADEINRATPKTQSALLEAMAEGQVTVLGQTYQLPQPFVVMATQNPRDHAGTYALPEAQADRFMFNIIMPVPHRQEIEAILDLNREILRPSETVRPSQTNAVAVQRNGHQTSSRRKLFDTFNPEHARSPLEASTNQRFDQVRQEFMWRAHTVGNIDPQPDVKLHLIQMFLASNQRFDELEALSNEQRTRLTKLVPKLFQYGFGPRAFINLMKAAKAWRLLFAPANVPSDDLTANIDALVHILIPTLRHRIKLLFEWEELYESETKRLPGGAVPLEGDRLSILLADFCLSTAPNNRNYPEYYRLMRVKLAEVLATTRGR